jgi:ATP-dependent DNA helicase RecG
MAMIFIKKHINLSFDFDGSIQRREIWQYPLEALRELLLNAVIHRDYRSTSDIIIKIFDDRIVFTSPGKLYGNLTVEDLKGDDYVPVHRNRLLAEAFYLAGDIEKYGTGFVRIRQWLKNDPEITFALDEAGDHFRAILARPPGIPGQAPDIFRTSTGQAPDKHRTSLTSSSFAAIRVP